MKPMFSILILILILPMSVFASDYHVFKKDESLWFLAHVYYGQGAQYTKILQANNLTNPDEVADGQKIVIPDPKFSNQDPAFWERYDKINEKRMIALKGKVPVVGTPETTTTIKKTIPVQVEQAMPDGFRIKIKKKIRESSLMEDAMSELKAD